MQQAICMNASLHQPSDAMYLAYSPPPANSGQVLEFEYLPSYQDDDEFCRSVTALPPADVNESLDSLPDLSTVAPIFDEYINSLGCTRAPQPAPMEDNAILASNIFHNSDSFMIDLPNPLPATRMSACSSALGIHGGEIKEVIRWADPINSTRNIRPTLEIASSPTAPRATTSLHLPYPHITTSARPANRDTVPPSWIGPNVGMQESSSEVAIRVNTDVLNLHDGYAWRKYGEKCIKNHKFIRSYFRCAEIGCEVKKRTERCSTRQEDVVFTYLGRHNHRQP